MSVYLIGAIEVRDPDGYARYREGVAAALAPFEGLEILSVDDHPKMIEGAQPANHLFLIRFPSAEQVREFFASEPYQRLIAHRHGSSEARFLMTMRGVA